MDWHKLLSPVRYDQRSDSGLVDIRSQFQRDYDRIIFSPEFRKMQSKTQVFPFPKETFVHNRLTHSLEVASVGRSLARIVADFLIEKQNINSNLANELPTIVSTACLAHDLGNPPFGHSGEDSISSFFISREDLKSLYSNDEWSDLTRFEGNANALRLLTHQFPGRRAGGFSLTMASLAATVKYPYPSAAGKMKYGYFTSERAIFEKIVEECGLKQSGKISRHPLVYLVEAADDISYLIMDMEDAHRMKILSTEEILEYWLPFLSIDYQNSFHTKSEHLDPNEKVAYLRSLVINSLVSHSADIFIENYYSIMDGDIFVSLAKKLPEPIKNAMELCKFISYKRIYTHPVVQRLEIVGHKVLTSLLQSYMEAILSPEKKISKLILQTIPDRYHTEGTLYQKTRCIIDYISSRSDFEALRIFREMNGIDLPEQIV